MILTNVRLLAHVAVSRDMLASFCDDVCFVVVYVARDVVLRPMGKIILCTIRKLSFCPRCKCTNADTQLHCDCCFKDDVYMFSLID